MNSVLNEIKEDSVPCKSRNDIFTLIDNIAKNCSFIIQSTESLPRKTDAVAVLFDTIAAEIYIDLIREIGEDERK